MAFIDFHPTMSHLFVGEVFRRIPINDIVANLSGMAEKEELEVSDEALELIARQATGSLRDAISLLDQLSSTGEPIDLELAQTVLGTATSMAVVDVVSALLECDPGAGLDHIHKALDSGSDVRQFTRQIVDYLRSLLLIQIGEVNPSNETPEMEAQLKEHAGMIDTGDLIAIIRLFNQAATDSRAAWQPGLPLEIAFIEACQTQDTPNQAPNIQTPAPAQKEQKQEKPKSKVSDVTTPPPSSAEVQSASVLDQKWPQVLTIVRKDHPNLYGLLNSCQSRHLAGSVLVLGFASDILKNQMNKRENLEIVQQVVSSILEQEIAVRCVISTAKNTDIPSEVDEDGMVASALRDMGGEIVDVQ